MKILTKKCIICGEKFTKPKSCGMPEWINKRKFCSQICSNKWKKELSPWNKGIKTGLVPKTAIKKGQHFSIETEFKKGSIPYNKGKKMSVKKYKKLKKAGFFEPKFGEKAPMWKGDKAGYHAIHLWIIKKYGHPKQCLYCGTKGKYIYLKNGRKRWSIDWANRTGNWTRDKEDYIGLCRTCHNKFDKGLISL